MSTQSPQPAESTPQRRITDASVYSAHVQEAMRYNKLPSSEYTVVMTILDAVLLGHTEKRWEETHQQIVQSLSKQAPDKKMPHADADNRYEQTVANLKDLLLWPWSPSL